MLLNFHTPPPDVYMTEKHVVY